jgi:glycosyltransferase involved in cell wall biosynthesis
MGTPRRICWLGTYESDYPRTRVLIGGLRARGVEVVEVHQPVWETTRHKAGAYLAPRRMAQTGVRWLAAWARLAPRLRAVGSVDAVVAGYPAQPDAPLAWLAARVLRAPLVVDAMVSLVDTLTGDRGRAGRLAGPLLAGIDRIAFAGADVIMADTRANADFLIHRFGLNPDRVAVVPVGAEPECFPSSPPTGEPVYALFYGKLAPLHGVETIVAAARLPGTPRIRLIGEGQLGPWLADELARDRPANLEHVPWTPYEQLGDEVRCAAICLGVFGSSEKAGRVVPNKVYQAMAAARPVVTADTPGVREVICDGVEGLLVPPSDPRALADALRRLEADPALRRRLGDAARARFLAVGHPDRVAAAFLDALSAARTRRRIWPWR